MTQELVIEAGRTERHYWQDLWRYRELFQVLAWRDISVRYKQTVIGIAWALIRPFLMMVVFTVIFGKLAKLPSDGTVPYALMVFAGMLPWSFFSSALSDASNSLLNNEHLISKVYFPRLILPTAAVVVAFVDFLAAPLFPQPYGRCHRRVLLVHPRRAERCIPARHAASVGVTAFFLLFGIHLFRKMEKSFADLI